MCGGCIMDVCVTLIFPIALALYFGNSEQRLTTCQSSRARYHRRKTCHKKKEECGPDNTCGVLLSLLVLNVDAQYWQSHVKYGSHGTCHIQTGHRHVEKSEQIKAEAERQECVQFLVWTHQQAISDYPPTRMNLYVPQIQISSCLDLSPQHCAMPRWTQAVLGPRKNNFQPYAGSANYI